MSTKVTYCGWDIGGAHLKYAALDARGKVLDVAEIACPLWQGREYLIQAIRQLAKNKDLSGASHAVTMTGELCDFYADRSSGVRDIARVIESELGKERLLYYARGQIWYDSSDVAAKFNEIASANWDATVSFVASRIANAVVIDIGSTTTDMLPICNHQSLARGEDDYSRLVHRELVYSGVVRTAIMALVDQLPYDDVMVPIAAEYFATTADAYRILGLLPEWADLHPSADNGEKTTAGSARRLFRMIGLDFDDDFNAAKVMASFVATAQMTCWREALALMLSRPEWGANKPSIIGLGPGQFAIETLAREVALQYQPFEMLIEQDSTGEISMSTCGPAVAVAKLLSGHSRL